MPPGSPQLQGRAAIRECWQGMIDAGVKDLKFTCHEAIELGDTAIEVSSMSGTAPGEGGSQETFVGKYIVIWKKGSDDDWYVHRDIWNFDA
jgi:ketosteroid isomerase-like protein